MHVYTIQCHIKQSAANYAQVRFGVVKNAMRILNQLYIHKSQTVCMVQRMQASGMHIDAVESKPYNTCEVASSISEDLEHSGGEEVSIACDVADDGSDVRTNGTPNSITGKVNAILSKIEEQPQEHHTVDTTDINVRLDKLEKLLQKQYAILKRLL